MGTGVTFFCRKMRGFLRHILRKERGYFRLQTINGHYYDVKYVAVKNPFLIKKLNYLYLYCILGEVIMMGCL